jgi:magnesium transporter
MNVHVPGQGVEGYAWFASIVAVLVTIGVVGGFSTYKLMLR